jgi:glycerophosphoryl diester phosphodiesterase
VRPFLDTSPPIAFAHRGGAKEAPENTMLAFEAAVALGYRYLETDTHVTADGVLVAFHDADLDRLTDGTGPIADLSLREVQSADAGFWFTTDGGRTFPHRGRGLRVPALHELLVRFPTARFNIDAKADSAVAPMVDVVRSLHALDRVCAASFSDRRIARIRALSGSRLCTSMGRNAVAVAWLASRSGRMPAFNADCVQVPVQWRGVRVVDRRFVRAAHAAGLQVHVWTVDDEPTMTELLELGVDGIMTDKPSLLRAALTHRGQWSDAAK